VFVDLPEDALKTLRDECTLLVGVLSWVWLEDVISTFLLGCWGALFSGALAVSFGEGREQWMNNNE